MMLYFFDTDGRYVGRRARIADEPIPEFSTEMPVTVPDGHEAYYADGVWTVTEIPPAPVVEAPAPVQSPEERIAELEAVVADLVTAMEALVLKR